jgi:hypothetical protein
LLCNNRRLGRVPHDRSRSLLVPSPVTYRLLAITLLASIAPAAAHATRPAPPKAPAHAHAELGPAAQAAIDHGFHAALPPHISTLLGLANEQKCDVLQGIVRTAGKIQGIDVVDKNHDDIVIFTVDEASGDQTFYLTSPAGTLRKLLQVKAGVGLVVRAAKADQDAFQQEKKMWEDRLANPAPSQGAPNSASAAAPKLP